MAGIIHSANVSAMGPEWLSVSDNQAAATVMAMVVVVLCGDASAAVQNSSIVLLVGAAYRLHWW